MHDYVLLCIFKLHLSYRLFIVRLSIFINHVIGILLRTLCRYIKIRLKVGQLELCMFCWHMTKASKNHWIGMLDHGQRAIGALDVPVGLLDGKLVQLMLSYLLLF